MNKFLNRVFFFKSGCFSKGKRRVLSRNINRGFFGNRFSCKSDFEMERGPRFDETTLRAIWQRLLSLEQLGNTGAWLSTLLQLATILFLLFIWIALSQKLSEIPSIFKPMICRLCDMVVGIVDLLRDLRNSTPPPLPFRSSPLRPPSSSSSSSYNPSEELRVSTPIRETERPPTPPEEVEEIAEVKVEIQPEISVPTNIQGC